MEDLRQYSMQATPILPPVTDFIANAHSIFIQASISFLTIGSLDSFAIDNCNWRSTCQVMFTWSWSYFVDIWQISLISRQQSQFYCGIMHIRAKQISNLRDSYNQFHTAEIP